MKDRIFVWDAKTLVQTLDKMNNSVVSIMCQQIITREPKTEKKNFQKDWENK